LQKIFKSPFLGYGVGVKEAYLDISTNEGFKPHNIFLELLLQGGIINLLVWTGALFIATKKVYYFAKKKDRIMMAIIISSLAVLVHGMFEPNLFSFPMDIYFWTIIGLGVARYKELRVEEKIKQFSTDMPHHNKIMSTS
jgi:O-antigen ligase